MKQHVEVTPRQDADPGDIIALWWCPVCQEATHTTYRPGRAKVYCSNSCRQRAYRWRKANGIRLFVRHDQPAQRCISTKRHAIRDPRDVVGQQINQPVQGRDRVVAVCGTFAWPSTQMRFTHHRFVPDHPWSCATCVALVHAERGSEPHPDIATPTSRPPQHADAATETPLPAAPLTPRDWPVSPIRAPKPEPGSC